MTPTTAQPLSLAAIIAECRAPNSPVHQHPERAVWFRQMLQNAIANQNDKLAFFARSGSANGEEHDDEHIYNCITRCEHALNAIASV